MGRLLLSRKRSHGWSLHRWTVAWKTLYFLGILLCILFHCRVLGSGVSYFSVFTLYMSFLSSGIYNAAPRSISIWPLSGELSAMWMLLSWLVMLDKKSIHAKNKKIKINYHQEFGNTCKHPDFWHVKWIKPQTRTSLTCLSSSSLDVNILHLTLVHFLH